MFLSFISIVVCGAGQFRRRQYVKGAALMVLYVSSLGTGAATIALRAHMVDMVPTALLFLIAAGVWIFNLLDIREQAVAPAGGAAMPVEKQIDALYEQGRLLSFRGDLGKARVCFENILKLKKDDMDSVYQLAKICKQSGDIKGAARLFKRYLKEGDKLEWREEAKDCLGVRS